MTCDAKILPSPAWFRDDNQPWIVSCQKDLEGHDLQHAGQSDGYTPTFYWLDDDRRTFTGDLVMCPAIVSTRGLHRGDWPPCCLPSGHHGRHAA